MVWRGVQLARQGGTESDRGHPVQHQDTNSPVPVPLVAPYLTEAGLCLFHPALLYTDCTLVARLGCLGCIYSVHNLDPIELPAVTPRYRPPIRGVEISHVC